MDGDELRRQIGQLFIVGFDGTTASEDIKTLIRPPYNVGSIILFERNIESAEQLIALTNELQQTAKDAGHTRPLLIGIDQENGLVTRVKPPVAAQLPGGMALGATGSADDARRVASATGELLSALGINMNYAPCCDVNSEPANPVIGVRSPGDDGTYVGKISSAIAQGLRENGVVPCAKHFPGHGDTTVDSHYGLPVIPKSKDALESCELIPFRRVAAEGIEAVMTAHIVVPSVDDSNLPASLSKNWMNILRDKLQYNGLIVSDCLEMDAVRAGYGTEKGAAMAIGAGTDCAMICHTFKVQVGAMEEVYNASKSGTIPLDQISKSVTRVSQLKDRFLSWEKCLGTRQVQSFHDLRQKHQALATEVYGRSATVIRDEQNALPLSPTSRLVYMYFAGGFARSGVLGDDEGSSRVPTTPAFLDILRSYNSSVAGLLLDEESGLDEATLSEIKAADAVILATRNAKLSPKQTELGLKLAGLARKLVVVATCDPYDFMDNPEVKTVLATYEPTVEAFQSATRIIFGEVKASGVPPVLSIRALVPVRSFDAGRDMQEVIALWHKLLPHYAVPTNRLKHLLTRSNGKHFAVRVNGMLVGFVATYVNEDRPTAFISAILVDSAHQSRGIGTALIEHARQYLRGTVKAQQITIGSSDPRFWPGVPLDIADHARYFFVRRGFCPTTDASSRDYMADLATYQPPAGILERAADCGIKFVPWTKDMYEECMANQRQIFGDNPVWVNAYERLAREDRYSQAMVAIDSATGKQIGWTLMQEPGVGMEKDLAFPPLLGAKTGQIGCVGVHPNARKKGVGLAMIASAALDLRRRGMERVFIDWVTLVNWYEKAGFKVWREYRPMVLKEIV
ncbi:hypothetical protein VTO42DRAFT_7624 [Malbranchea cinnamomea]